MNFELLKLPEIIRVISAVIESNITLKGSKKLVFGKKLVKLYLQLDEIAEEGMMIIEEIENQRGAGKKLKQVHGDILPLLLEQLERMVTLQSLFYDSKMQSLIKLVVPKIRYAPLREKERAISRDIYFLERHARDSFDEYYSNERMKETTDRVKSIREVADKLRLVINERYQPEDLI